MLPNSPRTGGPGGPLGQAQLSNNGGGSLGISPSSAISSSVTNSVGPMLGTSTKTIVSASGTIPLQPSVVLPAPPPPLPSMGGMGRGISQLPPSGGPTISNRGDPPTLNLRQTQQQHSQPSTSVATYSTNANPYISSGVQLQSSTASAAAPVTAIAPGTTSVATVLQETFRRIIFTNTAKFFGVDAETEESSRAVWNERRRRFAIKRFGGVKDEYLSSQHHQHTAGGSDGSGSTVSGGNNGMGGGSSASGHVGGGYGTHHFGQQVGKTLSELFELQVRF